MKHTLFLVALFMVSVVSAQALEPQFEKEGNKVKATYFHANGAVSQQGYFLNEKLEGEWTMFNEAGQKVAQGNYANGKKTGTWLFWDGEFVKEVDFEDNRIAAVEQTQRSKTGLVKH
ncbi:toxin-antitoxin system YwqK family antitoxin [Maribacter sp. 2307ULW6-5]|uniref:toxin-antitoxin system YwqK family antitoxin n=1 Tax=Maribacter sp. 2307ULW6-5 TaxID=3386275 RepID=UPI0039BCCD56